MNVFTNTKKFKKLIIVLVFLLLFNFCYPNTVKAGEIKDNILVGAGELFYGIFDGILKIANRVFVGSEVKTTDDVEEEIVLTPENIIKGKFLLMDANIFRDISSDSSTYLDVRLSYGK